MENSTTALWTGSIQENSSKMGKSKNKNMRKAKKNWIFSYKWDVCTGGDVECALECVIVGHGTEVNCV